MPRKTKNGSKRRSKRRNVQDLTLRNRRALVKRLEVLEVKVHAMQGAVRGLALLHATSRLDEIEGV